MHESKIAFLNKVNQRDSRASIVTGNRDDYPEERFDQSVLCSHITASGPLCEITFLCRCQHRPTELAQIPHVTLQRIFTAHPLPTSAGMRASNNKTKLLLHCCQHLIH